MQIQVIDYVNIGVRWRQKSAMLEFLAASVDFLEH